MRRSTRLNPFGLAACAVLRVLRVLRVKLERLAVLCLCGCIFSPAIGCGRGDDSAPRLLIIGMDGLDPVLLKSLMDAGKLPNFSKLAASGSFKPLGTSMPPQSPVAWSNFISGADPGTHEIYDFIHRRLDPKSPRNIVEPYLSTSDIVPGTPSAWTFGATHLPWFDDYRIPLLAEQNVSLRQGGAFWDSLVAADIDTTLYRIPANYPPPVVKKSWFGRTRFQCLCGMGTPDLRGTQGEFTFFSSKADLPSAPGGSVQRLLINNHQCEATLEGPRNYLKKPALNKRGEELPPPYMRTTLKLVRDPERDYLEVRIGDRIVLLRTGQWSEWTRIEFDTGIPGRSVLGAVLPTSVGAIVRMYAKSVHPEIELYVTAMNLDPQNPANPISTPTSFAADLADATGPYYTVNIPEDTKALRATEYLENARRPFVLNEDQFLEQVRGLLDERMAQWTYALENFDRGLMFFYFGHTDQLAHIFWRDRDPGHPGRVPEQGDKYASVIDDAYIGMDRVVGEALAKTRPQDTLIVMSDHGFASFRRGFSLNTWLGQHGYINLRASVNPDAPKSIDDFDWDRTRAYALGINSLYINVKGREKRGIVSTGAERTALMQEIAAKLKEVRDVDGTPVIDTVYIVDEFYPQADPRIAPDMLIGYARNYRGSWATALGGMSSDLLEDNTDRWSGDHCIAQHLVPGVILCNRALSVSDPNLTDVAPTILSIFGLDAPTDMRGRVLLAPSSTN